MIQFEKEVIAYLGLPNIPKKEHDGKTPFDKGVAVVGLGDDREAYAACKFNPDEGDKEPRITKVFGIEPFRSIKQVLVVPNYMASIEDVKTMDLDAESKKKAEQLLNEANEIENEGVEDASSKLPDNEYLYDFIHNDEEARAYIKAYNKRNGIKRGNIPSTHENIINKLTAMWMTENKAK